MLPRCLPRISIEKFIGGLAIVETMIKDLHLVGPTLALAKVRAHRAMKLDLRALRTYNTLNVPDVNAPEYQKAS